MPVSVKVVGSTIFVLAMSQAAEDPDPWLYKLCVIDVKTADANMSKVITPTTTIQLMGKYQLNALLQASTAPNLGSYSGLTIQSVQDMQIVDFGVNASGSYPIITLLATLSSGSYMTDVSNANNCSSGCTYPNVF